MSSQLTLLRLAGVNVTRPLNPANLDFVLRNRTNYKALMSEQYAPGVNAPSTVANSWEQRVLNTIDDPHNLIGAFTNNQFRPLFNGWISWQSIFYRPDYIQTRLRNITDNVTAGLGLSSFSGNVGASTTANSTGHARVEANKVYGLEYFTSLVFSQGLALNANSAENESYCQILFERDTYE